MNSELADFVDGFLRVVAVLIWKTHFMASYGVMNGEAGGLVSW